MQPPVVIKQGTSPGQVSLQPGIVTVPMSANSSMPATIQNVMTMNKPQNVVVTTQNLGTAQQTILPNVQILNMRAGAPSVSAQKSVATVTPRVVIGTPQVVGARTAPGITLQTLQSLQPGQQGHLLLKTENGQYQLLRVGPASTGTLTPQGQAIRLSTVPAHTDVASVSSNASSVPGQTSQVEASSPLAIASVTNVPPLVQQSQTHTQSPATTTQKPSDNTKEKCRNFLANLLDLSSKEPKSVERNVRTLIQELIDAKVEPEAFCDRLEKLLNASPQPCLIGFLKKSLPLLRQSLVTKELEIIGINPPSANTAFSVMPAPTQPVLTNSNVQLAKPAQKTGGTIAVLQNIPVQTKLKITDAKSMTIGGKSNFRPAPSLTVTNSSSKSLLKEKKNSIVFSPQPFTDDKTAGDDDINDVAAMGGVNLAEESQRILGSTDMIGTQIRSCKDEFLIPLDVMQARLKAIAAKHGMGEPSHDVAALMNHAVRERLKNLIEKLAVIAQHRIDLHIKSDIRYEQTQDVKSQLKFLEEVDRADKKRREDTEREMLLRAAKSRSKNEDPEQAKLKAKAKEMQRVELEELRQREANLTALQAIGPRKKARFEGPTSTVDNLTTNVTTGHNGRQLSARSRMKRVTQRDMLYLMEQEKETSRSEMLFRMYLK